MRLLPFKEGFHKLCSNYNLSYRRVRCFSSIVDPSSTLTGGEYSNVPFQQFIQNKNDLNRLSKGIDNFNEKMIHFHRLEDKQRLTLELGSYLENKTNQAKLKREKLSKEIDLDLVEKWISNNKDSNYLASFDEFLKDFPKEKRQTLIEATFDLLNERALLMLRDKKTPREVLSTIHIFQMLYLRYNFHQVRFTEEKSGDIVPREMKTFIEISKENYYLNSLLFLYYKIDEIEKLINFYHKLSRKFYISLDLELCRRLILSWNKQRQFERTSHLTRIGYRIMNNIEVSNFITDKDYTLYLQDELFFYISIISTLLNGGPRYKKNVQQIKNVMFTRGFTFDVRFYYFLLPKIKKLVSPKLNEVSGNKAIPRDHLKIHHFLPLLNTVQLHWENIDTSFFNVAFFQRKDASKILDLVENTSFVDIPRIVINFEIDDDIIVSKNKEKTIKRRLLKFREDPSLNNKLIEVCKTLNVDLSTERVAPKEVKKKEVINEINDFLKHVLQDMICLFEPDELFKAALHRFGYLYLKMDNLEYFDEFVENSPILSIKSHVNCMLISLFYHVRKGETNEITQLINDLSNLETISQLDPFIFSRIISSLCNVRSEFSFDCVLNLIDFASKNCAYVVMQPMISHIEGSYLSSGLDHPIRSAISEWKNSVETDGVE